LACFCSSVLHDITEAKRLFETVEQIFERGSTPMIMVCGCDFGALIETNTGRRESRSILARWCQ
jgi:hypothetical protein